MDLSRAISIVAQEFEGKYDKGGEPYILHCLRVMNTVRQQGASVEVQCAAVMHDLLEDIEGWSRTRLLEEGFAENTVRIIGLLTKDKDDLYMDYIKSISYSAGATMIKLADLKDNSDITRLKGVRKKDFDRIEKYHIAYTYLKDE